MPRRQRVIGSRFAERTAKHLDWPPWPRRVAAAAYFVLLTWMLLAPATTFQEVGELFPHQDKAVHAGMFIALAFLVRWALAAGDRRARSRLGVLAALLIYAAAIEALQPLLGGEGRQFDWLDMASNLAGTCCGWLLCGTVAGYHAAGMRLRGTWGAGR